MAIYKNTKASHYNSELKAVLNIRKKEWTLNDGIVDEEITIETVGQGEKEKIVRSKVEKKSQFRVNPVCPVFLKCGGCTLQHLVYQEQLSIKTQMIQSLFDTTLHQKINVHPTIGMKNPYHYRNKSQVVMKYQQGKTFTGFYEEGTHQVIDYQECHLQDIECNKIVATIKELMKKMHLTAYDEDRKTGLLRHVLIKTSKETGQILVVLVTGSELFPGRSNFIKALLARHPQITTIIQNINSRKTSVVMGEKEIVLYGKGYILDKLLGHTFKITSKSFYQINHEQTEVLYQRALDCANLSTNDIVLDAYCGVGTIGIIASSKVQKVIGVELVKDAVENAKYNAKLNDIKNISFFNQDATPFMMNMARRKEKLDVLIMDPPRSGSTPEFIQATLKLKPKRIVYISCNPHTQVRDIKLLLEEYQIKMIHPVDLFPQTGHVETITLLCLKEPKKV